MLRDVELLHWQQEGEVEWDDLWSTENFGSAFGFEVGVRGFSKEIRGDKYHFRPVTSAEELLRVLEIQRLAWRWSETDLAPTHILALMEDTGGGVFGAYDEKEDMVAFAGGFGGGRDFLTGKPAIISSMLAVAGESYRSGGIGKELKIIQAYYGYLNGYSVMKWFYDPERGENAALNLRKLGAKAEEFKINKYGQMQSELYGPVPTDRFRAVWRFTERKAVNRIRGAAAPPTLDCVADVPIATHESMPDVDRVLVQISGNIDAEEEKEKIRRRYNLRKVLGHYFTEKGYIATEFISGSRKNGNERLNYYLLEPLREQFV